VFQNPPKYLGFGVILELQKSQKRLRKSLRLEVTPTHLRDIEGKTHP